MLQLPISSGRVLRPRQVITAVASLRKGVRPKTGKLLGTHQLVDRGLVHACYIKVVNDLCALVADKAVVLKTLWPIHVSESRAPPTRHLLGQPR